MAEERFSLASGGPFSRLTQHSFRDERRVVSLSLVLIGFTWVPIILLAFLVICLALNCVVCAAALTQILFAHAEVMRFRDPILALIIGETAIAYLPLCVFAHRLYRAKREWLLEHGHLAATLTRTFHEHWISNPSARSALESEESSQMIDYSSVFNQLADMRPVPLAWRDVLRFVVVIALPAVPVVLTAVPLKKIVPKLLGLVGGVPV